MTGEPQQTSHAIGEMPVSAFIDALADRAPTPGGGAVAGVVLSTAAGLATMVLAYSEGRERFATHAELHATLRVDFEHLRKRGVELADADARAYARLNGLWKLPKDDPARAPYWPAAVAAAIDAPLAILLGATDVAAGCRRMVGTTNAQLASDLAIAADLAGVAGRAAIHNVRVNLPLVEDEVERDRISGEADARLGELGEDVRHVLEALAPGGEG